MTDYIGFVLSALAASASLGAMPTRHGKKQKKQGNENAAGMRVFPWLPLQLASSMALNPLHAAEPRRKKQKTKSSAKQDLPKVQQQSVNEQAPVEVEPAAQTFFQAEVCLPDKSVDQAAMDIEAKFKQSSAGVSLASFRFDCPAGRPGWYFNHSNVMHVF